MLITRALQQKLFPKTILIAGPYAGEFGHELLDWQGYIRARKSSYEEVHVITYPDREILYEGCIVHAHDIKLENAGYYYGNMSAQNLDLFAKQKADSLGLKDYDVFNANLLSSKYLRKVFWEQKFIKFYVPPVKKDMPDLIFHFRQIDKTGPDKNKNYPTDLANLIVELCNSSGYKVGCIGHPSYSYCPPNCIDFRVDRLNLEVTISAICAAKLVIGELSGPMHLANLCNKSTLVWAQNQWRLDYCTRGNIFNVPIYFVTNNTFKPDPSIIKIEIDRVLLKK